jgi:IS30 family transposase
MGKMNFSKVDALGNPIKRRILLMSQRGMSTREISKELESLGVGVSYHTISSWIKRRSDIGDKLYDSEDDWADIKDRATHEINESIRLAENVRTRLTELLNSGDKNDLSLLAKIYPDYNKAIENAREYLDVYRKVDKQDKKDDGDEIKRTMIAIAEARLRRTGSETPSTVPQN